MNRPQNDGDQGLDGRVSWRADDGFLMPMTLFVCMIALAVGIAMTVTVGFTIRQASMGRVRVQSTAAAEAGLDAAYAALQQSAGTALPCSLTGTGRSVDQNPSYSVAITYLDSTVGADGNPQVIPCTPGVGVAKAPATAIITAEGVTAAPAFEGAGTQARKMESVIRLRAGTASWEDNFSKALFSESAVTTTNQWNLNGAGADFYTNGNFGCNSSSKFGGSVGTQGTASLTNNCTITGTLYAKGKITTSTTGISIGGDLKSSTDGASIGNSPLTVGGSVLLAKALTISDGKSISAQKITGTVSQNLGTFADPPHEAFPKVSYDPAQWTSKGWSIITWPQYIAQLRAEHLGLGADPAPSYWTSSSYCTIAYQSYSLNAVMYSPTSPTVIDARTCSTAASKNTNLQWQGNSKANELRLRSDMTIITNDFYNTGSLNVTSVDASGNPSSVQRTLRIIVPWVNGSTCAASGAGGIKFDAGGLVINPTITTFLYTPGTMTLTNGITLGGQLYGCTINSSVTTNINFKRVGAPTSSDASNINYSVDIVYKRDIR